MPDRTLIAAPAWLGDMVMTQSLVAVLKAREPDVPVDVLAPSWSARLAARMPGVDGSMTVEFAHGRFDFFKRLSTGRALRPRDYSRAIVLPSSWKSGLAPWFAGIARRTGYVGEYRYGLLNDIRPLDREKVVRTVERFVGLAGEPGEPPSVAPLPVVSFDAAAGRALAEALGLSLARPVIALCPGAESGPAKRWPARHFADLAEILTGRGCQTWILGSKRDAGIAEAIIAATARRGVAPPPVDLAGRVAFTEAIDLLSLASVVVSNDSGLMHVAAAIGRPLVALYGSTSSKINPPLSPGAVIHERELPCRPCFQSVCPLGHLNCLNLIAPADVAGSVLDLAETGQAQAIGAMARSSPSAFG